MNFLEKFDLGLDLAVLGTIITIAGTTVNNLLLNHVLAMQIWFFSNPILALWAFGTASFEIRISGKTIFRKKRYWDGGLSGVVLCFMYLYFTATNFIGLMKL